MCLVKSTLRISAASLGLTVFSIIPFRLGQFRHLFFFILLDGILHTLSVLHYLVYICLCSVFGIEPRSQDTMNSALVTRYLWKSNSQCFKFLALVKQSLFLFLMLFDLLLEDIGYGLICRRIEMVSQSYLFDFFQVCIVIYRWVKIEQYWEINRLIWVQELILEAEALDFIEVKGTLFREDLVDGNTSDGLV